MRLVVAGLNVDGVVQQDADPTDRRSRLITISTAGTAALAGERHGRASDRAGRLGPAAPSERDLLRAAIPILNRLADPLRRVNGDGLPLPENDPMGGHEALAGEIFQRPRPFVE
jgi:hypothetical protein